MVLDSRGKDQNDKAAYYFLWTTFLCESNRQHERMLKKYARGEKTEVATKNDLATGFTLGESAMLVSPKFTEKNRETRCIRLFYLEMTWEWYGSVVEQGFIHFTIEMTM